jgi:hypothetical protein
MEAAWPSETSVVIYMTTQNYIQEDETQQRTLFILSILISVPPIWGPKTIFFIFYHLTAAGFLLWGTLSGKRMGL